MPNWCYNSLVVYGDENDIAEFIDYFASENGGFTFSRIMPMPSQFECAAEGEGSQDTAGALHWCREHWGTKWDACDVNMNVYTFDSFSLVNICFDTAWNPPFPVLDKLGQDWSKLRFLVRCQMDASCLEDPFISQYHPEHGFRDVLIERWKPALIESLATGDASLDVHPSEEVRPDFLEEWGRDVMIHKAMMLLGFGDEERIEMIEQNSRSADTASQGATEI